MSSTILPALGKTPESALPADQRGKGPEAEESAQPAGTVGEELGKNPFLMALGDRVRQLRARRGMTRKATALAAEVSERHLANLEYGVGNASILVLLQVAQALQCSLAELTGDITTSTPEWLMLREMLGGRDEACAWRWVSCCTVRANPLECAARALPWWVCAVRASPRSVACLPKTWAFHSWS
jgi:XRE family aerobic/anaerobic benzoate catabolism transcriptional regulator